jgi:hypothetical protein
MDTSLIIDSEGPGKRTKRATRFSGDFQTTFAELDSSEDEKAEKKRKASAGKLKRTKECPGCGAVLGGALRQCTLCDYQFTSKSMIVSAASIAQESVEVRERFPFEPERDDDGSMFIQVIEGRRPKKSNVRRWMRPQSSSGGGRGLDLFEQSATDTKFDHEYLVKYKNVSYRELQWLSATEIEAMGTRNKNLLNRYLVKLDRGDGTINEDGEIDPSFLEVERVLDYKEEEVNEIVDDVAAANKAIADAAAATDEKGGEDEEEEGEVVLEHRTRGEAKSSSASASSASASSSSSSSSLSLVPSGGRHSLASSQSLQSLASQEDAEGNPLSRTQINVERCRRVLEKLMEDPYSVSFVEPVDTELYNDYLEVVDEAMCLETVKERLEAGK